MPFNRPPNMPPNMPPNVPPNMPTVRDAYVRGRFHRQELTRQNAMAIILPSPSKDKVKHKTPLDLKLKAKKAYQERDLLIFLHCCPACGVNIRKDTELEPHYLSLLAEKAKMSKLLSDARYAFRVKMSKLKDRFASLAERENKLQDYMRKFEKLFVQRDERTTMNEMMKSEPLVPCNQLRKDIKSLKQLIEELERERDKLKAAFKCCLRLRKMTDDALTIRFGDNAWYKAGMKHASLCNYKIELKERIEKAIVGLAETTQFLAQYKSSTEVAILENTKLKDKLLRRFYSLDREVQILCNQVDRMFRTSSERTVILTTARYNIFMVVQRLKDRLKEPPADDTFGQLKQIKKQIDVFTEIVEQSTPKRRKSLSDPRESTPAAALHPTENA